MKISELCLIPLPDATMPAATRYNQIWEMAEYGNGRGYEAIWITEHHFSNYGLSGNPLMLLSKAAEIAPDMRLGTGVLVLPLWHPLRVAEDVAILDVLSGGRVDVGIGRGYQPFEFESLGVDIGRNRDMFNECLNIVLDAWTKDDIEYEGRFWKIPPTTVLPKPAQQPHPPLWMAATTPPSIRAAVERGYHLMTGTGAVLEELEQRNAYIDSVLEGLGRSSDGIERAVNRFIVCTTNESDIDAAIEAARWQIRASRSLTGGARAVRGVNVNAAHGYQGEPDRDTWRRRMIAGNPDECLAQMRQLAEAGITYTFGVFDPGGLDQEITMRSLKLFTEEVVPALPSIKAVHADTEQREARMNSFLTDGPKYTGV